MAPAAVILGLGALVAGRFWLAPAPDLPSFAPTRAPRFRELSMVAERPPQAVPLTGRLIDGQGQPIAGALLYARPRNVPVWGLSDAEGRFRLDWPHLDGDPSGAVPLAIAAWGFAPLERETAWQAEPLEIVLPEREAAVPAVPLPTPALLEGRCMTARTEDTPPFDWEVLLVPVDPPEVFGAAVVRRVQSAPDGTFRIPDLSAGSYRAHVLPAWAAGGSWPDLLVREVRFDHDPLAPAELRLELAEGVLFGTLLDSRGRAIEGALLLLSDAKAPSHLWPPAKSDPRGGFLFEDLPAGGYSLFIEAGEARLEGLAVEVLAGRRTEVQVPPLVVQSR
jgi:hypothetical protein